MPLVEKASARVAQLSQSGWIELIEKARTAIRRLLLIGIPIFVIYNVYTPWSGLKERSLFALLLLSVVFLEARHHRGSLRWIAFDSIHLLITLVVFGYTFLNWLSILHHSGAPTTTEIVLGMFAVYVVIVATWRVVGKPLLVVVFLFAAYTLFGQYLPLTLGGHSAYSIQRIASFMLFSENGLMGFIIGVTLKYIVLFLLLGKVLQNCGALDFIMDLSRVLFRRGTTGPPLMAVFSSAMVGSIIGSGTANVFVTGNITIPLMKRVGVKPELAGAIEATASTGGQIMPPVMGFVAFFIVALLGVPYIEVVKVAFIPAALYFLAVGAAVFFRTRGIRQASGPTWTDSTLTLKNVIFRVSTISFLGTIGILVTLLSMHYSLQLSALYAMSFGFVSSFLGRDRFTPRKAVETLEGSGRDVIGICVASLIMGLIAGSVLLTGLGAKIPTMLIALSGGYLVPLLFFTMLACIILGLGVPTSISYLVVAITVSASLTQLGIPILHAHMFVFYSAMAAMLTPPVALTAYAAATVAQSNFWKTGLLAFILGMPAFLVPFAFILRPGLMMSGSPLGIIGVTLLSAVGLVSFIAALGIRSQTGFEVLGRIALGIGGILLLLFPIGIYSVMGAVLCLVAGWKVYLPLVARIIRAGGRK